MKILKKKLYRNFILLLFFYNINNLLEIYDFYNYFVI